MHLTCFPAPKKMTTHPILNLRSLVSELDVLLGWLCFSSPLFSNCLILVLTLSLPHDLIGEIEIELENGKIITVEAKEYVQSLKLEVEALKETLRREKLGQRTSNNGIVGSAAQSSGDFRGIAEYIASRQGDIKALTKGIKPEVIDSMKKLVDFVMEGGEGGTRKDVPRDQIEMELPGSALQQLALWQLVLGYRLREAEANGEYWKLLE